MAELHSNIYFRHGDERVHGLLHNLFAVADLNSPLRIEGEEAQRKALEEIAEAVSPGQGAALMGELLDEFRTEFRDQFGSESIWESAGYWVAHFVNGSGGDEIAGRVIGFLHQLCPSVDARAWGCGDDDPWEYWFRYEDGVVVRRDDEPFMDEEEDLEILASIYAWWHEGMPATIREGFLNELSLDGEHVVFTGQMAQGCREDLEAIAEEFGAVVQKRVTGETTLLVVGQQPEASDVKAAKEFGLRIISEAEFNDMVDA